MNGAAGGCGGLQASFWYNDFIALRHILVGGMSGLYDSYIFKVVSVLFSIILLVFLQSVMSKRVPFYLHLHQLLLFSEVWVIAILTGTSDTMVLENTYLVVSDRESIFFKHSLAICMSSLDRSPFRH